MNRTDKPYKCRRGAAWVTQIRAGTTSRDATDEEEARLYMQSGRLRYDRKPVPGAGYRASRNELVKEVLRDYRYVEATGLGVPRKIIAGMRQHNGTEPDLVEEESRFIVRLWKRPHNTP